MSALFTASGTDNSLSMGGSGAMANPAVNTGSVNNQQLLTANAGISAANATTTPINIIPPGTTLKDYYKITAPGAFYEDNVNYWKWIFIIALLAVAGFFIWKKFKKK